MSIYLLTFQMLDKPSYKTLPGYEDKHRFRKWLAQEAKPAGNTVSAPLPEGITYFDQGSATEEGHLKEFSYVYTAKTPSGTVAALDIVFQPDTRAGEELHVTTRWGLHLTESRSERLGFGQLNKVDIVRRIKNVIEKGLEESAG
jgi:hypothetical protein